MVNYDVFDEANDENHGLDEVQDAKVTTILKEVTVNDNGTKDVVEN